MNLVVHYPDVLISGRRVPQAWRHEGAAIVINGDRPGTVRMWPVGDWKELVELWSTGFARGRINARFVERGYSAEDVRKMRALILANDHILPPIDRAIFILSGHARRTDRAPGGFSLFDRPVRAVDVVRAANRILETLALPQIRYPDAGGCEV